MKNIPTAEEFLDLQHETVLSIKFDIRQVMIEFAKLHVEAALKEAIEKIEIDIEYDSDRIAYPILEEYSILNAYPLTNIK
jgi:hypothetical protein